MKDLAAAGSVNVEWRAVAGEADGAWQRAFEADFGAAKAVDFVRLRTWRDKYM